MHGATPSIYAPITKQFKLGGNGAAYGASTDTGIGWAYNADSGFSVSSNVVSKGGSKGFLTDEAKTNWSTQVAYTTDQYHVSLITALKYNGWTDSYYTTTLGKARPDGNSTNYGLRAYWRPDTESQVVPEISGGYDTSTVEGQDADTDAFFVGLTWKDTFQADDKIGLALGQPQTADTDTVEPFTWEAYYSFKINDSISMTPAIFGASDRTGTAGADLTGGVKKTTDFLDRSTWILASLLFLLILFSNITLISGNESSDSELLNNSDEVFIEEILEDDNSPSSDDLNLDD